MKRFFRIFPSIIILAALFFYMLFSIMDVARGEDPFIRHEFSITDYDYLYDEAIKYLEEQKENELVIDEENIKDIKVLSVYKPFEITEDSRYKYAYMWILTEAYYVKDNEVVNDSGSSLLYKFKFKNNKIEGYSIPKDGGEYVKSIKEMCTKKIYDKVNDFQTKEINALVLEMNNKKDSYYDYLK